MENRYIFDYYYGAESEQFSFFRVPKILFTDGKFRNISTDAKILYGMMLDRMSLSRQNQWIDDENRVYIIYTLNEIMNDLCCGKDKGVHLIAELDERGIGLIERRKQGFGKPALIYVKNFIACNEQSDEKDNCEEEFRAAEDLSNEVDYKEEKQEAPKSPENSWLYQTSEKTKSLGAICRSREFGKTEVKSSEKPKSRLLENRSQEFGKTEANNTDKNKTDGIKTNSNYTYISPPPEEFSKEGEDEEESFESDSSSPEFASNVLEYIKQNIEFDRCMQKVKTEDGRKKVSFLLNLICDVVCHPRAQIRIGGIALPYQDVRERFLKLTAEQVLYVVKCMQSAESRLNNPSAYAITALYNAGISAAVAYGNDAAAKTQPVSTRFEEFWECYPLKVRKIETEKEYANLLLDEVSESDLVEAAKNYAGETSILQSEKLCYPTNFLAKGTYKDYLPGKYIPPQQNLKRQRLNGPERYYSRNEINAIEQALLHDRPQSTV